MVKTGPQRYPGASTAYWHQSRYGGSAMESNVGVIHTTEGRTVPSYGGGASAPNFTALPDMKNRRLVWYQHFDFDVSSRALVNRSGGVETNSLNAVQVELVGTCDERNAASWGGKRAGTDYIFWPDAPDWALAELGKFVRWAHDQHGLRMQSTVAWKAYKKGQVGGSYGANGVRLTGAQWQGYYGWLGHQHVPENSHGDPGNLDFARVLEHAKGTTDKAPSKESDDMPDFLSLGSTKAFPLDRGKWVSPVFDTEWADSAGIHAKNARALGPGFSYTGFVHVRLSGLTPGSEVQVRTAEDDMSGKEKGTFPLGEGVGTEGDTFLTMPICGKCSPKERLRVELTHFGDGPVTVKRVELKAQVWKH